MKQKQARALGTTTRENTKKMKTQRTHRRPDWVPQSVSGEEELCPDCFKVVGERSRYTLVCLLGKAQEGMTVGELTDRLKLRQPTVTHHLKVLRSVDAVAATPSGRERVYRLNRTAHCFEECNIPY